jgi:uncharacterized membrane protein YdjX (TVP38/TMEM64 family)
MKQLSNEDKTNLIISVILLGLLTTGLVYLALTGKLWPLILKAWDLFKEKEAMRSYIESWEGWAPLVFIVIQALQVILAPFPGEFTGAVGGFLFDGLPTSLYSTIGLTIGSGIAFLAARIIGLPLVKLLVNDHLRRRFHFLTERRGIIMVFLLYAIPGFPKDLLTYLLGLSPMGFWPFLITSNIGRIPGTVMLSFSGAAIFHGNWGLLIGLSVAALIMIVLIYFNMNRISEWIKELGEKRSDFKATSSSEADLTHR